MEYKRFHEPIKVKRLFLHKVQVLVAQTSLVPRTIYIPMDWE